MRARVSSSASGLVEAVALLEQAGERVRERGVDRRLRVRDRRRPGTTAMRRASASTNGRSSPGRRAVHVAPALGGLGVDVVAAEDDLERAAAADQRRQALRAAAAGDDPDRDLGLGEHRPAERGEAHVHASASSLPPPRARPSITAIVAFGMVRKRSTIALEERELGRRGLRLVGSCRIRLTSAWAMKNSGLAQSTTTTRTSSSASASRPNRSISTISAPSKQVDGRVIDGRVGDAVVRSEPSASRSRPCSCARS